MNFSRNSSNINKFDNKKLDLSDNTNLILKSSACLLNLSFEIIYCGSLYLTRAHQHQEN